MHLLQQMPNQCSGPCTVVMERGAEMKAALKRPTRPEAHQSHVAYDWDKERKKLTVLSSIFFVILAVLAIILTVSVLHGHL